MTNVGQFCFGILIGFGIFIILYVIFAPWLAQIDISKNTKSIAKELEEMNKTLKDLKRSVERKENDKKSTDEF